MASSKTPRRQFLMDLSILSAGVALKPDNVFASSPAIKKPEVVIVKNGTPQEMVREAVEMLGGMGKFVKKGQVVLVKPNMSWDRRPEQGANTHPDVIAEVVKLALEAGAKQVRVFDRTCNEKRRCYKRSGVADAARKAGAKVYHVNERRFKPVRIPNAVQLNSWEVYEDVLEADVIINVPVLKHHSLTRVSMGVKNLMGFMGGDRGKIHRHFAEKIVDFAQVVKPTLTIIDATRVLQRNGPQGGNLNDVKQQNTIIASEDLFAADAVGAGFLDIPSHQLDYLVEAQRRDLAIIDVKKMTIRTVDMAKT